MTFVTNTTGVITGAAITVTAATNTKAYDGTTLRDGHADDHRRQPGQPATRPAFDARPSTTKNVGTGKTLTPAGSVNDGNSGNNYTVTFVANTTGVITPRRSR